MPFSKIRGQTQSVGLLQNAVQSGRVHHAYCFEGPEGVGKFTTALSLAQALNCTGEKIDGDGCGNCSACRRIASGNHPDVEVFAPDGQFIKIDQMRTLRTRAYLKPIEGPWKLFIINGAHRMNRESANCVLKVLEEPPQGTVLILVAQELYSLPDTIPSRCAVVPFKALEPELMVEILSELSERPREELEVTARISGGNLTEAVRYLDLPWIMEIRGQAVELLNRAAEIRPSIELLSLSAEVVNLAEKLSEKLEKAEIHTTRLRAQGVIFRIWISVVRDWLSFSRGLDQKPVNSDMEPQLREMAGKLDPRTIVSWLEIMLGRAAELAGNANRLLNVESLLIDMSNARNMGYAASAP